MCFQVLFSFKEAFGDYVVAISHATLIGRKTRDLLYYEIESTEVGGLFLRVKVLELETPEDTEWDEAQASPDGSERDEDPDHENPQVIVEVAIVDAFKEREIIFQRDYSAETGTGAETK